jgi:hypothetical protein
MITALRNRHRIIVMALALIVPTVFVSGLMIRKSLPPSDHLPLIQTDIATEQRSVLYEDENLWKGLPIATRIVALDRDRPALFLELQGTRNLAEPDVLVYWSESQPLAERLPESAVLLGKFSGMEKERVSLPERALAIRGYLTIYSLARMKIVAIAELYAPGFRAKGASS